MILPDDPETVKAMLPLLSREFREACPVWFRQLVVYAYSEGGSPLWGNIVRWVAEVQRKSEQLRK